MKLIKIEIEGFKSFANKVAINFNGDIVGIVGPNGSGKSNINDAIKWVLGEQSKKNLRSDFMTDVIFAGSKGRDKSNIAQVSLTFDNPEKKFNIDSKKIVITRKIERTSNLNEYFINDEPARLRDLATIAMESGVGKSSLAIISQGTIASIADSSPEDRRYIFEEAAGISHYRARKKEALVKLEKTNDSLAQMQLVIDELANQLRPLKSQSKKASLYVDTSEKLKEIEVSLLAYDIDHDSKKLEKLNYELSEILTKKELYSSKIQSFQNQISIKSDLKYKLDNDIQNEEIHHSKIVEDFMKLQLNQAKIIERRKVLLENPKASSNLQINIIKSELSELSARLHVVNQLSKDIDLEIQTNYNEIKQLDLELTKVNIEKNVNQERIMKLKFQLDQLLDYEKNRTNLQKGVQVVLENREFFLGIHEIVANIFNVHKGYEVAIETILKNALHHIVVDDANVAINAINFLKKNKSGNATFIPLNKIQSKLVNSTLLSAAQTSQGFIAEAASLVNVDPTYEILKNYLLGGVFVTENIENARDLSEILNYKYLIVTLDGDVIRPSGIVSGGHNVNIAQLNFKEQIDKINENLPQIQRHFDELLKDISDKESKLAQLRSLQSELRIKRDKNIDKENILELQFNDLKIKFETMSKEELNLDDVDEIATRLQKLEVEKSNLKTSLSVRRAEVIKYNEELQSLNNMKIEIESNLFELQEKYSTQINEKTSLEFYISKAKKRLVEAYELTFESIENTYNKHIDIDRARREVSELRQTIKQIGNVNIQAIEDFEKINIRYTKLIESQNELESAKKTIEKAIQEMDALMISRFDSSKVDIEKHLQKIFIEMFNGGSIHINYSDPENLLETGIEISAQLPGKAVRSLKLFSGGEKSLITISLLFAILESKALPLCILDEVEASLDEVNVQKFANYLHKLKHLTQFVVVTHRIGTMENLDILLGATMQTPGITSIYSVEMAHAKEIIKKMVNEQK